MYIKTAIITKESLILSFNNNIVPIIFNLAAAALLMPNAYSTARDTLLSPFDALKESVSIVRAKTNGYVRGPSHTVHICLNDDANSYEREFRSSVVFYYKPTDQEAKQSKTNLRITKEARAIFTNTIYGNLSNNAQHILHRYMMGHSTLEFTEAIRTLIIDVNLNSRDISQQLGRDVVVTLDVNLGFEDKGYIDGIDFNRVCPNRGEGQVGISL